MNQTSYEATDFSRCVVHNPTCKIGIEFNGTYWHSSQFKERNYHFEKSKLAEQNGIRLIHFYEWEWDDLRIRKLVLDIIKVACGIIDNKIYARSCEVRKLTNKDVKSFADSYHLQGHRNATVTYGLFNNDSLVQIMSFSNTKYNKNLVGDNSWEIIRSCSVSNTLIVGGTSKLFHAFLTEYRPTSIFTYCDFNKFTGTSYRNLGMEFTGFTGPDMRWVINHFTDVVSRQPHRNKELKEISDAKLWGAGSKKFLFVSK